ncbi:MAG: hypothetical protein K9W42_08035 [Candidatus Heimdallarchaeota archaeon]|nr:hypothetical protein [Candidatus Heimdallarchaeota archaeon]
MKVIALYWGYLIGEEHLTDEQIANIDFGNPSLDTEFITFDPLASSYFQGRYFTMVERKLFFPHRKLPAMRTETLVMYDETFVKIFDPPAVLATPAGIYQAVFIGKKEQINKAITFLSKRINLRFSPCDLDVEKFFLKLRKTRLEVFPKSLVISNLQLNETLSGNLEVFLEDPELFLKQLKAYKPKVQQIKLLIKEVAFHLPLIVAINGTISYEKNIDKLSLLDTITEVAIRSVYTGIPPK